MDLSKREKRYVRIAEALDEKRLRTKICLPNSFIGYFINFIIILLLAALLVKFIFMKKLLNLDNVESMLIVILGVSTISFASATGFYLRLLKKLNNHIRELEAK